MKIPITLGVLLLAAATQAQVWVQQGPGPNTGGQVEGIQDKKVVGAVRAVVPHPSDAKTVWVGAVNGGIWKTCNALDDDPSWTEQLGLGQSLSIGALALDPTDTSNRTLLAGSGVTSAFQNVGGARVGVYRTTDGGANWTRLDGGGTIAGKNIIGVAPRGSTLVIAAGGSGVWRSTDTGATWTTISGATGTGLPAGTAFDLAGDAANPARLFTNAGTNGIYRSTDTGATWTKVSDTAIDTALNSTYLYNVRIAVGRHNDVYVAIVIRGQLSALFRSGDGGTTWTALDLPTTIENGVAIGIQPGGQGSLDMSIAAHPENANVVFVGGDRQPFRDEGSTNTCQPCWPNSIGATDYTGRLFRVDASQPKGSQSTPITNKYTKSNSSPHADSRNLAFDANGNLLEVDDGGIYRRTAPLTNTGDWFSVIGNLQTTEMYAVAWDPVSGLAFGGVQDNGVPEQDARTAALWRTINVGDGGVVAVEGSSTPGYSVRYTSSAGFGNFRRAIYPASGKAVKIKTPALTPVEGPRLQGQYVTPFRLNDVDSTRLVIGAGNGIYESFDQGETVHSISTIVVNQSVSNPIAYGAKGNPDVLYAGVGATVYVRTAKAFAAPVQSAAYPGKLKVLDIAVHPLDPLTAYVVDASTVYLTTDAGATWKDVTSNLLSLKPGNLRSVAFSTSETAAGAVVGADTGVFLLPSPSNPWRALGTGLPHAPVFDLSYDADQQMLAAGLLGRGAWTIFLGTEKR